MTVQELYGLCNGLLDGLMRHTGRSPIKLTVEMTYPQYNMFLHSAMQDIRMRGAFMEPLNKITLNLPYGATVDVIPERSSHV